ncbi:hypothetical protein IMG5_154140 [Ichthyophthirius multifiliis]|uniref:ABC transporter family protein n=1 Tax=Ichthyophthirius multifiliis TaxID=5932 RepID=G0QZ40_ICHMU|nr:hypothetical protein IMG5_154140 [Ichthyophthirius multifiliis]EGR29526.1 hypothetical protein IMG5_154140 [Ichthyophthirius multifiliis]|eukprot:XP_004030762.1 hypothetical protein IMG5_154140 [Ichthyophthirius multifiliis]
MLAITIETCIVCKQYKYKDDRISLSQDIYEGIKSIKQFGWEEHFKKKIDQIRKLELKCLLQMSMFDIIQLVFWNGLSYFLLFFFLQQSYDSYQDKSKFQKNVNVFSIIAVSNFIIYPMGIIPFSLSMVIKSFVSLRRIQILMNQKEIQKENTEEKAHESIDNFLCKPILYNVQNIDEDDDDEENDESKENENNYEDEVNSKNKKNNNSTFELKISTLTIHQGTLNVIIGLIGSGKSALMNAILNEMEQQIDRKQKKIFKNTNKILVNGTISYVSQNHWLQNKSVKENILFGKEYDENWYKKCFEACELKQDFDLQYQEDQRNVGPQGNNLSGGQKQRICLCRAIYQGNDIYLLDDVFSNLDYSVAQKIYENAILQLLIKQKQKTVILITSQYGLLNKKEEISKIIYVKNGKIEKDNQKIKQFINGQLQKENFQKTKIISNDDYMEYASSLIDYDLNSQAQTEQQIKDNQIIIKLSNNNEEKREKGDVKLSTIILYLQSMTFILGFLYFISSFFSQGSMMLIDFWLKYYFQPKEDQKKNNFSFQNINKYFKGDFKDLFLSFIYIFLAITFLRSFLYCICNILTSKKLFCRLNKSIMYSKMKFFDCNPVGRIINRVSDDIVNIDELLPASVNRFTKFLAIVVGWNYYIIILAYSFCFIAIFAVNRLQKLFRISNREIKRLNSVNAGKLLNIINETCKGLSIIRAFGKEDFILKQYISSLNENINSFLISQAIQIWMLIRLQSIMNAFFLVVGISSIIAVYQKEFFQFLGINNAVISMCLTYVLLLSGKFSDVIFQFCTVEQQIISVERIGQYLQNEQESITTLLKDQQQQDQQIYELSQSEIDQNYSIIFKNVCFAYNNNLAENGQYVISNFSLKIKKGEKIAICGRTGSGKTSIFNILFGMYPIQKGQIFVNNKSLQDFSLKYLRSQISIIPQFGFLYKACLQDNLDPTGIYEKEYIQQKINNTGLQIRNNQQKFDNNNNYNDLDFQINQGGENLSNGEKQIINFLRIILRDSEIICLDEATSNMDPYTDYLLNKQIFQFAEGKTLIVITHRLENIEKFDRIVVLEKGRIVECDNHKKLRQIHNGFFNRLQQKKI